MHVKNKGNDTVPKHPVTPSHFLCEEKHTESRKH